MSDRRERTRDAGGDRPPPSPDQALGRALRGLPRERAAAGFTRRVLDRLDATNGTPVPVPEPRSRRASALGLGWAAASAVAAVGLAVLVTLALDPAREGIDVPAEAEPLSVADAPSRQAPAPHPDPESDPVPAPTPSTLQAERRAERLAALDAERARIARELAEIRRLAHEPLPVVYVGGDESVDFVVDPQSLSRMARLGDTGLGDRTLRPTGYTIEDPERNPR